MLNPEIINKNIWERLKKIYKRGQISGAYLFIGSEGLGKIDLAFQFIELDKKLKKNKKLVETGAHSDVIILEPEIEEKKGKIREKQISLEETKEALKRFNYCSEEAKNKFLIIKSINKLTLKAANSLLKTIEELPQGYVVIMTISAEGSLLKTIQSRCQRIYFNLKSEKEITEFIKKQSFDLNLKNMEDIVFLSRGRIKEAQKCLENKSYQENNLEKLNNFKQALKGDLKMGFQIAVNETKDKQIFSELLNTWLYYLNNFLKQNISENSDRKIQQKIFEITQELNESRKVLNRNQNANPRLLLENFFVQIK